MYAIIKNKNPASCIPVATKKTPIAAIIEEPIAIGCGLSGRKNYTNFE
jgi:hypothetical protein